MTIGQVSRATGMSADTLRYYERMALLAPPRDAGRRRHYGPQDLLTLSFVARMRATDMPLAEIRTYLALAAQGDATAMAWKGEMLEKGIGYERSLAEAVRWYERAAEQDHHQK